MSATAEGFVELSFSVYEDILFPSSFFSVCICVLFGCVGNK